MRHASKKLSEAEIKTLLSKAKGWSLVNGKLTASLPAIISSLLSAT